MGTLYEKVKEKGGTIVGDGVSAEGFDFGESTAIVEGKFVGLALDEDNQADLSDDRIDAWVSSINSQF